MREPASDPYVYKVLTIDGGGLKGLFPAAFLASLESDLEFPLVDYFDLIVGTSTGGIIALGLGAGLSARQISDFYKKHGPEIFSKPKWRVASLFHNNRYDSARLRSALQEIIGEKKLGESRTRLVIPSANLDTGEVHLNKTSHHERFQTDYKKTMVEVAMDTASAPMYFEPHRTSDGGLLADGGIWANNPAGLAAVEALGTLGWPVGQVRLLSLGTTYEAHDGGTARRSFGFIWPRVDAILRTIFALQSSGSVGTAQHLLGHHNVIRINPAVARGHYSLDKIRDTQSLEGLGASEARKAISILRTTFFDKPSAPFDPFWKL